MTSATSIQPHNGREVYVPLQKLDKCGICNSTTGLRLCSSWGERIYCSTKCQTADWKEHKKICRKGKTERLDLYTFWPFLAYLAEICRMDPNRPSSPATLHKVTNNPTPNSVTRLPDGTYTNS